MMMMPATTMEPDQFVYRSPKPSSSAKSETVVLKVLIHCEGCRRKIKHIIHGVDGVEEIKIDAESGKVTVMGSGIDAKSVLERLRKYGKPAEVWPTLTSVKPAKPGPIAPPGGAPRPPVPQMPTIGTTPNKFAPKNGPKNLNNNNNNNNNNKHNNNKSIGNNKNNNNNKKVPHEENDGYGFDAENDDGDNDDVDDFFGIEDENADLDDMNDYDDDGDEDDDYIGHPSMGEKPKFNMSTKKALQAPSPNPNGKPSSNPNPNPNLNPSANANHPSVNLKPKPHNPTISHGPGAGPMPNGPSKKGKNKVPIQPSSLAPTMAPSPHMAPVQPWAGMPMFRGPMGGGMAMPPSGDGAFGAAYHDMGIGHNQCVGDNFLSRNMVAPGQSNGYALQQSAEYATNMFSDENANNCHIM